ncbi:MAG: hypothetical protein ACJAX5_001123, partial [Patiriisocius sp.]
MSGSMLVRLNSFYFSGAISPQPSYMAIIWSFKR